MKPPVACPPWGDMTGREVNVPIPDGRIIRIVRDGDRVLHGLMADAGETPVDITITGAGETLYLTPYLPDKPVVLRPNHTLQIVPGTHLFVFIRIPLVPSLATWTAKGGFDSLVRFSASDLSLTWFGDPVSGEAAYSISTPIDGSADWKHADPWVAYCPLKIENRSPEILTFRRMILRVPYLSLYTWSDGMVTSELTILFRGRSQVSQIQISKGSPDLEEPLNLYREPQMKKDSQILRRSFSLIKSLSVS